MKKKMLVLFLSLCMVLGCMCTAAAEPVTASVSYDSANSEITVTGTAYGPTSVTVAKEGLLPENMSDSTRALIFKQIEARGSYSCVLGMPDNAEGGKYIVYVACAGGEATDSFMFVDSSSAADVIQKLNAAAESEFEKIITDNAAILGIDISDELYIKNSEKIISRLAKMNFEDPDDFYTKYAKTYAICAIEGEENPENIEKILSKYGKQLGIDYENDFANDARMDSKIKADLLGLLHKTDYVSLTDKNGNVDFAKIFKESKAVAAVAAADSWVVLKKNVTVDFAEDFADLLNDSTYKKVKDKDRTFEKLAAMDRSSIENIEKNFLAAAKAAYNEEKKNNSSSSGTGSSGSSGSGSVTSPAVTPEMRDDKPTAMFSDVTSEHWGFDAVNTLASEKIISGYGDGTFLPSNNITRAEFTKLIVGIEEKLKTSNENDDKQLENSDVSFSDVNENDWFAPFVASAAKSGFINGSDGKFRPNDNITREDAALIIYRMLTAIGKKPSGYKPFADRNDISDYAKDAVLALGGAKIVQGSGENMFLPKNNITRAEAAQLLYNVLNK